MTTEQTGALGAQNTAANPAQNTTSTSTAQEGQSQSAKTFTQAELDQMIADRVKRASESATKKLLDALGVASVDELPTLKTTIDDARKRKESEMTESQKAQAERDKALEDKKLLEQRIAQIETERRNDRIASALTGAATKIKANDTDDVLRYARDKHGEALNALIDDSGAVDPKKIDALLEKIKTEKPHYFTPPIQTPGSQSNAGGRVAPSEAEARKRASLTNQQIIRGR